jgi:hypothetical protein
MKLVAGFLMTLGLTSGAQAALVTVQMNGTWNTQYEYLGANPNLVPITVPISYVVSFTFDIDSINAWYVDPYRSYITEFGGPAMSSVVTSYGPNNPFGTSNPSAMTLLSRNDYSTPPASPAPFQNHQFVNRDYVQIADQTKTQNWSYGLEFHSGNSNIALENLGLASASEFLAILELSRDSSVNFYTSYWKYTFETPPVYGPPVTYTGGIGLNGTSQIVSVSRVPLPSSLALAIIAAFACFLVNRRRRQIPDLAHSNSFRPTGLRFWS